MKPTKNVFKKYLTQSVFYLTDVKKIKVYKNSRQS